MDRNATQANDAFVRCHRLVKAWYQHKGTNNSLLPQNLRSRQWTAENSVADLWSFFVITAYLTDQNALNTFVRQTLIDREQKVTHGGYDGFRWMTLKIDAKQVAQDKIEVRIVPDPSNNKAAFISEIKLTSP